MRVITARSVAKFSLAISMVIILGYVCLGLIGYLDNVDYLMALMFMSVNTMVWLTIE